MGQRVHDKAEFYIRRGRRKQLRRLIRKRPSLLDSNVSPIVFYAIWFRPAMLPWLLRCGVSPDCRIGGANENTPLMQAAAASDVEVMHVLLKFGANTEATNQRGERPLGFACGWVQPDAVKILLDYGADPNRPEDPDKTYLDWALMGEHADIVNLLRSRGGVRYSDLHGGST